MCKTAIGEGFTEICLCEDSSGRSGFLLGVNMLDLRWGQDRVGYGGSPAACGAQAVPSRELWQHSVAISSLVALAPQQIISSGSAGDRHLAVCPVAPGGIWVVL